MKASSWSFNEWVGAWWYVFILACRGSTIGFELWIEVDVKLAIGTRLCLSWWFIWFLCFSYDASTELGAIMRTEFLCISVLKGASGSRVKLVNCKSALTTPSPPHPPQPHPRHHNYQHPSVVYSTDSPKAVVSVFSYCVCLCSGFTAQSAHLGHDEHGQFI